MKRFLAVGFITGYLGLLSIANLLHLLQYGTSSHTFMYMIVWDMFCGWASYDSRVHIIAEGESETYYDLTHAPWGELHPYGYLGRENYDSFNNHTGKLGLNVLKHTQHEPISRILVVEECWPKKFNLPDHVWNLRYDNPKEDFHYYRLRQIMLPDGTVTQRYNSFVQFQVMQMVNDNPRLVAEANKDKPIFMTDRKPGRDVLLDAGSQVIPASAASGN
jgi:hypothetical protein